MATKTDLIVPSVKQPSPNTPAPSFSADTSLADIGRLHRRWMESNSSSSDLKFQARVAVLANYSTQFIEKGLQLAMAARGVHANIFGAPFNQWESELLNPDSSTSKFKPDIVVLSLTSTLLAYREAANDPRDFAARLTTLIDHASNQTGAKFLITLPEPLEEEVETTSWAARWRKDLTASLTDAIGDRAVLLDLAPLITNVGAKSWYAARFLVNGKFIANPETTGALSDYIAKYVCALVRRATRLVIVDLDNTLWGGIVGEDGWENVDLDVDGRGYGYLRLQRFLLGLHEKGVVLAAVSKNNADDALEVFRKRSEMILREEHFSAMQINWEPKSSNISRILEELNLTETGAVFLDDSTFERGEVRQAFPEIFVPDFPDDHVELVPQLISTGRFAIPRVSAEDRKRQQMYSEERTRRQQRTHYSDLDEYYRSLKLEMIPHEIDARNEQRVLDLLAKTNQFNPTTRRHTHQALERIRTLNDSVVFAYSLNDVHGAYGLIGAVIATRDESDLRIDTWVMSCRAMGRNVEQATIRYLAERAKNTGARRLIGEYIATPKNKPVADLYASLGFHELRREQESIFYALDLADTLPENKYVTIVS